MSLTPNKDTASLASIVYEIENTSFEKRIIDRFKTRWDFSNHGNVVNDCTAHGGKIVVGCPTVLIGG